MKAAILFYNNFVDDVTSILLKLKPYDPCVANKLTNVKKMTVVWHVDDLKGIHKSNNIFTKVETWLNKTYKRLFEDGSGNTNISRGNIHEYLGMKLDFQNQENLRLL